MATPAGRAAIESLAPGLHVISGDSASGTFKQTFGADHEMLIHVDALSCGPTPAVGNIAQWRAIRDEFWGGPIGRGRQDLLLHAERLASGSPIYLWAGTGIEDQLFVALTVHLARLVRADVADLRIVQFEQPSPRSTGVVVGMGELGPEQMAAFPAPRSLGSLLEDYVNAWSALTSPEPESMAAFAQNHPAANSNVREAMRLMLRRFPDASTGLNYWDFALLRFTKTHGPKAARIIGHTLTHEEPRARDYIGDFFLFDRMYAMADPDLPAPLMKLSAFDMPMRGTQVELTEFGGKVVAGLASAFPANPIDEWVGGVHLSSANGNLWFNDHGKIVRA